MRRALSAVAVAVLSSSLIVGCSTSRGTTAGSVNDTLVINSDGAGSPTFTRNFNFMSPASHVSGSIYFMYEPLVRVDVQQGNIVEPWLAQSWAYSDGGKTLTFHLRKDVTWSDGQPFTSADVKYTFEIPQKNPSLGAAPFVQSVSTPDKYTVVVHYATSSYHDLVNYASRHIVPEHIWAKQDLAKWTNPNPVGTGPMTLDSFSPQQIQYKVRSKPWEGSFHGVKFVDVKAFASESSIQQALIKNQVTWSSISWQDAQQNFVSKGSNNNYGGFPGDGSEGLIFNCQAAPTDNVHIRRALYWALDPAKLLKLYDTGAKSPNPDGLSNVIWKEDQAPTLQGDVETQRATAAKAELAKSGFTVKNGTLTKDGKSYPLTMTTIADYTNWKAYATGMAEQWKEILGLDIKVLDLSPSQRGTAVSDGKYTIAEDFLEGGSDLYGALDSTLDSAYAPKGKPAVGDNARYDNSQVDQLLAEMKATNDPQALKTDAYKIEQAIVTDVPIGPLDVDGAYVEWNATSWSGWPDPKTSTYQPRPYDTDGILTIQHLTPAQTGN